MPSQADIQTYLDFAVILAQAASAITLPHFRKGGAVVHKEAYKGADKTTQKAQTQTPKTMFNPVTEADRAAEARMRTLIESHFPTHAIIGEEYGAKQANKADTTNKTDKQTESLEWVLDPIDGTAAFITGSPLWGTLIALNADGKPILGLFDQPFTGERIIGAVGQDTIWTRHMHPTHPNASEQNDTTEQSTKQDTNLPTSTTQKTLHTSICHDLAEAKLATTSPAFFEGQAGEAEMAKASRTARLIRYGGDCYNYMMLAAGHIDAVIERDLKVWDVQALIPIIEGAGGVITDWQGGPAAQSGQIIASSNTTLHEELLGIFAPACP
ncbi:MAG: inositol monophosphatase family protein [Alphaproteobacteria bacterium]|nr:inositol monophosphatase family protein [Alphaproteobacteria bacterium]